MEKCGSEKNSSFKKFSIFSKQQKCRKCGKNVEAKKAALSKSCPFLQNNSHLILLFKPVLKISKRGGKISIVSK